ncbi:MAG TPA: hypothetical protein VHW00_04195 [Thermoanaerobaculia bacterium]|nr:hypothetical protein [Thermoanaerobaculia bacterium]
MKSVLFSTSQTSNTILDILRSNGEFDACNFVGILDDAAEKLGKNYYGLPVIGSWKDIARLAKEEGVTHFAVGLAAVKHVQIKSALFRYCVSLGLTPVGSVHRTAYISASAKVGSGNLIMSYTSITVDCRVGNNCLITSSAALMEDVTLEDDVTLITSFIGAGCHVEEKVYIGPGSSIGAGVRIGRNSIVGAGSVVLKDLPPNSFAVGSPARVIKANESYLPEPEWMVTG